MTHRRDFKTIFEVSECITDSTLFRGYDLAVVMNKNERMKKNRKLDVNEVVFSFRTSYRALVVVIFSGILTNY